MAAKAGKSLAMRAEFNVILAAGNFWFRFKEPGVTGVDQRPSGPECRKLLIGGGRTAPNTLQLLLAAAYKDDKGRAPSAELVAELTKLTDMQSRGTEAGLNKEPPKSLQKKKPGKARTKKVTGIAAGVRVGRSGGSGAAAAPQPEEDGNESESDDLAEAEVMDDEDPASDL